jgi:hypothetical protein
VAFSVGVTRSCINVGNIDNPERKCTIKNETESLSVLF